MVLRLVILVSLIPAAQIALAQDADVSAMPSPDEEIVVNGMRYPVVLTAKQVAGARKEFLKWQPSLAPAAALTFRIGLLSGVDRNGLELHLRSQDEDIPIPLIGGRTFVLPDPGPGDWAVYANRAGKSLVIEPFILSPGTDEFNRRLGDLRLQCRVYWGATRSQTSLIVKAMYETAGGCGSKKFGYYVLSSKSISSATLIAGADERSLQVSRQRIYRAPIADKAASNDSIVTLR